MSYLSAALAALIERLADIPALAPLEPIARHMLGIIEREPVTAGILAVITLLAIVVMVGMRAVTLPLAMALVAAGAVLDIREAANGMALAYAGAAIALFGLARAERRRQAAAVELQATVADIERQIDGFLTALDRRSRAADRRITSLQPAAFRDVLEPDETAAAR